MKRYEQYKDSGVEWIGEIPVGWAIKKLKYVATLKSGNNLTSENIGGGQYLVYGGNGVRGYYNDFTHDGEFILIGRQGALCGNINYAKGRFWATDHAVVVQPRLNYRVVWFGEVLRAMNLNQYSIAAAQPGLSVEAISNLSVPYPPIDEQTAIANHLDKKTAEIDALISQKERLLELYEEEKTAIINQVVTKGIDPDAPLKDSGVEWLGEIPIGWRVKRLKYAVLVNPIKDSIDKESSDEVVFLSMDKVGEDGAIDCSIKKPIAELSSGFTFFRKNDVIVAKITPCFENGKGALLDGLETDIGFGSTEFHVLRPSAVINGKFLYYISKSEVFMKVGEAFMSGAAGQKRVPTDFISDFPLVSLDLKEQIAIVEYIEAEVARIDTKIRKTKRIIELQKEYRTALISEVVTGKVKVPNLESNEVAQ